MQASKINIETVHTSSQQVAMKLIRLQMDRDIADANIVLANRPASNQIAHAVCKAIEGLDGGMVNIETAAMLAGVTLSGASHAYHAFLAKSVAVKAMMAEAEAEAEAEAKAID